MKKKFKVWTAAIMSVIIMGATGITASAAPSIFPSVTPPADSAGYIFERYEEKRTSGASEADLAGRRLVRQTFYTSKGVQGQTEEYRYDSQGKLSERYTIYGKEVNPAYRTVYTYDDQGNLTKETMYSCRDNAVSRELLYDGRGNITKWSEYVDGVIFAQADYSFVYDQQGKPLKYTSKELHGPSSTVEYSYDGQGRLIGKVGYSEGKVDLNIGYRYDAEGRIIEIAETTVAGAVLNFPETEYAMRWTFAYDAGGRLIKLNNADCIYDELGNLVREVRPDGSRFEYVYG